ncbi:nitrogenase component 1 [Geomesophilobacter sediminis]|uniref:Nitrogenase n=1 Tax=Geomesophilobacter sediminis TaxID=2798584 RepID=A0A8J7J6D7_9BACT|nr:nitrogenase component 1 [Geomesophilobacter sediminis]MBJ6724331.1 nitrogenase [Geomesophilobacter sediminis]
MSYLHLKVPPTRDTRLRPCNAYGGSLCNLVDGQKTGCLSANGRSFTQATGCQLTLSMGMAASIPNTVVIYHGPVGCGAGSLALSGQSKESQLARGNDDAVGRVWMSTNLSEVDIVSGGEKKLEAAILEAERRFRPHAIFIGNTCVPAIIGDDIDNVATRLQHRVNARIIPLHCEGFKTRFVATAYDIVYHGILRYLLNGERDREPILRDEAAQIAYEQRAKRTVNLLNVGSMGYVDEVELVRLLNAIGLEANVYPCFTSPEKFVKVKDAALSISICATHDDYFVEHLKEHYGVPYVLNTIPIGTDNVRLWLLDVADFFGLREEALKVIAVEEAELNKALAPLKKAFEGKTAFVSTGEIRAGAQACMLENDLGMKVVGIRAHHYDEFGEIVFESFKGREDVAINVAANQPFEQVNLIDRLKPDVFLGHGNSNVWAAKQGVPTLPIYGPNNSYLGYKGVFEVATRLERILANPNWYNTLGETVELPYKKSWYEQDPYAYIRQDGEAA